MEWTGKKGARLESKLFIRSVVPGIAAAAERRIITSDIGGHVNEEDDANL